MDSRLKVNRLSKEEARKIQEREYAERVQAFKAKEQEKRQKKIMEKAARYSFLNTSPGYKVEETSYAIDKDNEMRIARNKQQEKYSASVRKEM